MEPPSLTTDPLAALLAERTRLFGETIFAEITALALEHRAVNLGQGFPDFHPPEFVIQAAQAAVAAPGRHQYARGAGDLALAETLAARLEPSFGRAIDPAAEVTVTAGATEALFASILALVEAGDEVILFEPFYDAYPADVAIAGGVPRFVPLQPDGQGAWGFDHEELRRAFSPRTKLVVLNTPHNPTGKVYTRRELELIARLCLEHDAICISDEVYEEIVFDQVTHRRIAAIPGMEDRTVTISSAGKTFSVTGWKIGWAVASPTLSLGIRRIHQWIPFAVTTPLQHAVRRVLVDAEKRGYYPWLRQMYQTKRDKLLQILSEAGLRPLTPQGTYFVMAEIPFGAPDDVAFCRDLTTGCGVAAIPPSAFYCADHRHLGQRHARFCFCKEDRTLQAAGERLSRLQIPSS